MYALPHSQSSEAERFAWQGYQNIVRMTDYRRKKEETLTIAEKEDLLIQWLIGHARCADTPVSRLIDGIRAGTDALEGGATLSDAKQIGIKAAQL